MNIKTIFNLISSLLFQNKPIYAHYAVTHTCNLNCTICSNNCICPSSSELRIDEVKQLALFLKKKGIGFISLSGGEPLLREDILEIVKIFSDHGIKIQILTNTIKITKNDIEKLLQIKNFYGLSLSLHSISEKTSLQFYNDKNLYKKILENIEWISKCLKKNKILLNSAISPLNIDEIYDIADFAKKRDLKISFLPIEHNGNQALRFMKNDFNKLNAVYDFLIKEAKHSPHIFNSSDFLKMSKKHQQGIRLKNYCHAGKLYFSINPDGNISPCHKYHSHARLNFKDILDPGKSCSDCMRPCWIEISNFFTCRKAFFERIKKLILN